MQRSTLHVLIGATFTALLLPACTTTAVTNPQNPSTALDPADAHVAALAPSERYAQAPPPRQQPGPSDRHTAPPPRKPRSAPPPPPPVRTAPPPPRRDRRGRLGRAASFEIEPTAGPVGTVVNIYGRFRPSRNQGGAVSCSFPGAAPVSPDYMSVNRMILVVPSGAKSGPVRCTVGKQAVWSGRFSVTRRVDDIFVPTDEVQGLLGAVYKLSPNTRKLPNFSRLGNPMSTFVMPALQVAPRRFDVGFPLLQTGGKPLLEWYAIRFVGLIESTRTAEYTFKLTSGDGSKLYINDQLVIDNDGVHPPTSREGTIVLPEGKHEIAVEYFQGRRGQIALELWWKRGNNPFSAVPARVLSRYTVDADCSERPIMMCCRANTTACKQCQTRAQAAMDAWTRTCSKGGKGKRR